MPACNEIVAPEIRRQLKNSGDHDDRPRAVSILSHGEADRVGTVNKQATRDPAWSRATQLPRLSLPMKNRDDFDEDRRGGSQECGGSQGSTCAMFAFPYKIGCQMPFMPPSPLLGLEIAPTMCRLRHINSREKSPPRYKREIKG